MCYDIAVYFLFSTPALPTVSLPPHVPQLVPQPPHMQVHMPTPVHMLTQAQPQDIALRPSLPMSVDRPDLDLHVVVGHYFVWHAQVLTNVDTKSMNEEEIDQKLRYVNKGHTHK